METTTALILLDAVIIAVLARVIYSQEVMMKNYRDYLSIFDIDKVKRLHEWQEQVVMNRAKDFVLHEADQNMRKHLAQFGKDQQAKLEPMFVELEKMAWQTIAMMPHEWHREFIDDHFTVLRDYFHKELEPMKKANPGFFDNPVFESGPSSKKRRTQRQKRDDAAKADTAN